MKAESRHGDKRKLDWWLLINLVVLISVSVPVSAELITAARRTNWQDVGVPGGIPERTTICATLSPGASSSQINSAISNCPSGQVVKLNAGTYNLTSQIIVNKSNVTLRGSVDANGEPTTILNFNNVDPYALIYLGATTNYDQPWQGDVKSWTAGYSQGTTTLTLNNTTNLQVGSIVVLDQLNDSSEPVNPGGCTWCDRTGGNRLQKQVARITAINGNNITIEHGLYMPNWSGSLTPQLHYVQPLSQYVQFSGVEDLIVDANFNSPLAGGYSIVMWQGYGTWLRNVHSLETEGRAHLATRYNYRSEIRHCKFAELSHYLSQSYGVELMASSQTLFVDSIIYMVTGGILYTQGSSGNVFAYNYIFDMRYDNTPGWQIAGFQEHSAHLNMNMYEGNEVNMLGRDDLWGSSSRETFLRNRISGRDVGGTYTLTGQTNAVKLTALATYFNLVGNVLGRSGYHTTYSGGSNTSVYNNASAPNQTMFRHGNYDYVTNSTKWCTDSGEPGCFSSDQSHVIPDSFYLTQKPSWWCNEVPWPPIGSDLSPLASDIPAKRRYNGNYTCTTGSNPPPPPPPPNLPPSPPTIISVE